MLPLILLMQAIEAPVPGKEIYWIAGLMAVGMGTLFWQLLKTKDDRAGDWKGLAEKSIAELVRSLDAGRQVTDRVERQGNDTIEAMEKTNQILTSMANELQALERRLEKVENKQEWQSQRDRSSR